MQPPIDESNDAAFIRTQVAYVDGVFQLRPLKKTLYGCVWDENKQFTSIRPEAIFVVPRRLELDVIRAFRAAGYIGCYSLCSDIVVRRKVTEPEVVEVTVAQMTPATATTTTTTTTSYPTTNSAVEEDVESFFNLLRSDLVVECCCRVYEIVPTKRLRMSEHQLYRDMLGAVKRMLPHTFAIVAESDANLTVKRVSLQHLLNKKSFTHGPDAAEDIVRMFKQDHCVDGVARTCMVVRRSDRYTMDVLLRAQRWLAQEGYISTFGCPFMGGMDELEVWPESSRSRKRLVTRTIQVSSFGEIDVKYT